MATSSIKETIETIEDVLTNQFSDLIKSVSFEKFANTTKDKDYPKCSFYFAEGGTQIQSNTNVCTLSFEFLDAVSGRENKVLRTKEVVSDMFQTASMFVNYLSDQSRLDLIYPVSIETFDNKYKDGLGGVSFTLTINIIRPCLSM